jgi:hypothetical protein
LKILADQFRSILVWPCLFLTLMGIAGFAACAEGEAAPQSPQEQMKLAGIELDSKKRQVTVEAKICLREGLLEYLICVSGREHTFEHESLISVKCAPSLLHLTLLAIGLQPCEFGIIEEWETKWRKQPKSRVKIEVEFVQDGKVVKRDIGEFLASRNKDAGKQLEAWIFTGSTFDKLGDKQIYAADYNGSVVGMGLEGASLIQPGSPSENPYQGEERGWKIDSSKMPPRGTAVKLIFSPYFKEEQKAEEEHKDAKAGAGENR